MPISLGTNLNLKADKMSALYKDLYHKLNKAYAWTNTQTSGTTGTISIYAGNTDFVKYLTCSNINDFYFGGYVGVGTQSCYILNGKIYLNHGMDSTNDVQIGTAATWKQVTMISYVASNVKFYAINTSGQLYQITFTSSATSSRVGSSNNWTSVSGSWGICDGKLYRLSNTTATQYGTDTTWTSLTIKHSEDNGQPIACNNGNYYALYGSDVVLLEGIQNCKFIVAVSNNTFASTIIYYIDTNNDLYFKNSGTTTYNFIGNIPDVITLKMASNTTLPVFITSDGKAGFIQGNFKRIIYLDENIFWSDMTILCPVTATINSISSNANVVYAIGDGKLYDIRIIYRNSVAYAPTQPISYTIIDNNTNWKKIYGYINSAQVYNTTASTKYYYNIFIFNSEDAVTTTSTVYATKRPQVGDKTYSNTNMQEKSTITSVSLPNTITDSYMTYTRDSTRDSYYEEIPPATVHETVSVMDILNATNPNL